MTDLRELYQQVILDHNRRPRNFRALERPDHRAAGHNPLCGDRVELALRVVDGVVAEVGFQGAGCAISTASASLLTEAVLGKRLDQVRALAAAFRAMLTGDGPPAEPDLGKLRALEGVREYPVRVKCATLAWRALEAAIAGHEAPVTTE